MRTPSAEIEITTGFVQALLAEQVPRLASLPLEIVAEGWDNVMVRVGESLAVRLPRREAAVELLTSEQTWLPRLPAGMQIAVPQPVFCGQPSGLFAWPWSVVPWTEGTTATRTHLSARQAERLGAFLGRLHAHRPEGLPWNPHRSIALRERADDQRMQALSAPATALYERAAAEPVDVARSWIHGDLHPKNLIVDDGEIVMIVDWGDTCLGDPSTDISAFWMLCPAEEAAFRRGYGDMSESTWLRAQGTAVVFSALFITIEDDPEFAAVGQATLEALGVT